LNEQNKLANEANETMIETVTEEAKEAILLEERDLDEVAGGLILYPPYSKNGSKTTYKPPGCFFECADEKNHLLDHGNPNHVWWKCKGGCIKFGAGTGLLTAKCTCKGNQFHCDRNGWHRFTKDGAHV